MVRHFPLLIFFNCFNLNRETLMVSFIFQSLQLRSKDNDVGGLHTVSLRLVLGLVMDGLELKLK